MVWLADGSRRATDNRLAATRKTQQDLEGLWGEIGPRKEIWRNCGGKRRKTNLWANCGGDQPDEKWGELFDCLWEGLGV